MFLTLGILATMAAGGEPVPLSAAGPKIVLRGTYSADAAKTLPVGDWRNYGVEGFTGKVDWEWDAVPELAFDASGKPYLLAAEVGLLNVTKPLTPFRVEGKELTVVDISPGDVILHGISPGKVKLVARGVVDGASKRLATLVIDVGPRGPPAAPAPGVTPKVNYLLIVRDDQPATDEFLNVMASPAWRELEAKGVTVKDVSYSHATGRLGIKLASGTTLPTVIRLNNDQDAKKSVRIGLPVPLPKSDAEIRKLIEVSP